MPWWFWVYIVLAVLCSITGASKTIKDADKPLYKRGVTFWLAVAALSLAVRLWKSLM